MTYRVIDISAYQGEIDFSRVKKAGIWGVMLKATEGERYLSPAFEKNYEQASAQGLHVGAYHFLRAATPEESQREARFFLDKVKGKNFSLPLAVDIEAPEQRQIEDLAPIAAAFCKEVERQRYYAMIYSTVSWFRTKLASRELNAFDRWVAHVGVEHLELELPYGMWQFTWDAQIDGITGKVDESISYRDYPSIIKKAGLNHLQPADRSISVNELREMGYQAVQL